MELLLGMECLGRVEFGTYQEKVLIQRMKDGYLDNCPLFSDIIGFVAGMVDLVTAGFPCQPFSALRRGPDRGACDSRNMWPATRDTIRLVGPEFALLENVAGLLKPPDKSTPSYFGTVLQDLAQIGYDARWQSFPATVTSAPQRRQRIWVLATRRS